MYKVTRKKVVEAAMSLRGYKFRHQGRGEDDGVDCVGLLVVIGRKIKYPHIFDVLDYRRTPSAEVIRETLRKNCDEIPVEAVRAGDIYLMRMGGGRKPRHTAVRVSDETDLYNGIEPQLIHAYGDERTGRVIMEPVRQWKDNFVAGFRIKGLT